jgi:hypothetical protein
MITLNDEENFYGIIFSREREKEKMINFVSQINMIVEGSNLLMGNVSYHAWREKKLMFA